MNEIELTIVKIAFDILRRNGIIAGRIEDMYIEHCQSTDPKEREFVPFADGLPF